MAEDQPWYFSRRLAEMCGCQMFLTKNGVTLATHTKSGSADDERLIPKVLYYLGQLNCHALGRHSFTPIHSRALSIMTTEDKPYIYMSEAEEPKEEDRRRGYTRKTVEIYYYNSEYDCALYRTAEGIIFSGDKIPDYELSHTISPIAAIGAVGQDKNRTGIIQPLDDQSKEIVLSMGGYIDDFVVQGEGPLSKENHLAYYAPNHWSRFLELST